MSPLAQERSLGDSLAMSDVARSLGRANVCGDSKQLGFVSW